MCICVFACTCLQARVVCMYIWSEEEDRVPEHCLCNDYFDAATTQIRLKTLCVFIYLDMLMHMQIHVHKIIVSMPLDTAIHCM